MGDENTRERGWVQTYSGKQFFPLDPLPGEVDIFDIAHALSNTCRYTGHVKRFFSVAEHSVRCSLLTEQRALAAGLPEQAARYLAQRALVHDASEAYLCDIARPLKEQPQFAPYLIAEAKLQAVILESLGLPVTEDPPEVREADLIMLATERVELLGPPPASWGTLPEPLEGPQNFGWDPTLAESQFLRRFSELFLN